MTTEQAIRAPALLPVHGALRTLTKTSASSSLSFFAVSTAVQQYALSRIEVFELLGLLVARGIDLPQPLSGVVTEPRRPVAIPGARSPAACELSGFEVLDISRITLADIGIHPRTSRATPTPIATNPAANVRPYPQYDWDDEPDLPLYDRPSPPLHLYREQIRRFPLLSVEDEVLLAQRIEAGVLAQARLGEIQPRGCSREELDTLVALGRDAFRTFAESNLRLVVSMSHGYLNRGVDQEDLVQEGNRGLLHAIEMFDHRKGLKFSTYATWWIKQSITRALGNHGRTIRYPVHVAERLDHLDVLRRQSTTGGSNTDRAELAAGEADLQLKGLPRTVSFDVAAELLGEEGIVEMHDRYSTTAAADLRGVPADHLEAALLRCTERQLYVLRRRFGYKGEPATLEEIGGDLGVSRERVRQIESKALGVVGKALESKAF